MSTTRGGAPATVSLLRFAAGMGVVEAWPLPLPAMAALAVLLAATALLPQPLAWIAVLATVILLGVPHGALDGEVAWPLLRPRFGRAWFLVFSLPYLSLSVGVLLAWRAAPEATLAAFLAVSILHFGAEEAGPGRPLETLVRGGLPVLLHPAAVARIFEVVTLAPMPAVPSWLAGGALAWAVARCGRDGGSRRRLRAPVPARRLRLLFRRAARAAAHGGPGRAPQPSAARAKHGRRLGPLRPGHAAHAPARCRAVAAVSRARPRSGCWRSRCRAWPP